MAKLSRRERQIALGELLLSAIFEQQRTLNGNDAVGDAKVRIDETLNVLAQVSATIVNLGRFESTRMRYAAVFDIAFMEEHRRLERARVTA